MDVGGIGYDSMGHTFGNFRKKSKVCTLKAGVFFDWKSLSSNLPKVVA
jgi:hypothetical protein